MDEQEYAKQVTTENQPLPKQVCRKIAGKVAGLLQEQGTREYLLGQITRLCEMAEKYAEHVRMCLMDTKLAVRWTGQQLANFEEERYFRNEEIGLLYWYKKTAEDAGDEQAIEQIDREISEKAKKQRELQLIQHGPPEPGCTQISLLDKVWNFFELDLSWPSDYIPFGRWIRSGTANPLLCFGIVDNWGTLKVSAEECLLCDCFILATIHSNEFNNPKDRPSLRSNYEPIFSEPYDGKRFKRDKFQDEVWQYYHDFDKDKSEERSSALDDVFGRVKSELDAWLAQQQPPKLPAAPDSGAQERTNQGGSVTMTDEQAIALLRKMAKVLSAHAAEEAKRIRQSEPCRRRHMAILGPSLFTFESVVTWFRDAYPGMVADARSDYDNLKAASEQIDRTTGFPGDLTTLEESRQKLVDVCYSLAQRLDLIADKAGGKKTPKPVLPIPVPIPTPTPQGPAESEPEPPKTQDGGAGSGQTGKMREYAQKVLQLRDGEPMPSFEMSGTGRWWENEANTIKEGEIQGKTKRLYYKRVVDVLGNDAEEWLCVARTFEDLNPEWFKRVSEIRQNILDHTKPDGPGNWVEPQGGYLCPNENLRSAIEQLADELLQKVKSEGEKETTKAKAFLETIPSRLKELLFTPQRKARYEEARKQIDDDCSEYTKWEIRRDPYKLKDQEEAAEVFERLMPRYVQRAWEYYDWTPLEVGTKITGPQNRTEKVLAAYFAIERIVNVVGPPDPDEEYNRDREQFRRDFEGDGDAGPFHVAEGYAERLKTKYEGALKIIEEDLCQTEQEAGSDDSAPHGNKDKDKVLQKIADKLEGWRESAPGDERDLQRFAKLPKEGRERACEALRLLRDNIELLQKCKYSYGANSECARALQTLSGILMDRGASENIERYWGWGDQFALPGFITELRRWGDELDKAEKKVGPDTTGIQPLKTQGLWVHKGGCLEKLRQIDSNSTRQGIKGDKTTLKRLREYLDRRRGRPDIAKTLYHENGQIKTTMPCRSMFEEK